VTSHTLTPVPAAGGHRQDGQRSAAAAAPSAAIGPPDSVTGADDGPDEAALVWDLTMHRLYRAFAECVAESVAASPDAPHGCPTPPEASLARARAGRARVRLAATRHALNDIENALRQMAAGSYGSCQRCGQPITAERLQATPTTRWCRTCHDDHGDSSRISPTAPRELFPWTMAREGRYRHEYRDRPRGCRRGA
jgi:RNA polymerase-binding transcription factor DksA